MNPITRRRALVLVVAGALAPLVIQVHEAPDSIVVVPEDWEPTCDSFDDDPRDLAGLITAWELHTLQQHRPRHWRQMSYTGGIQWAMRPVPVACWFAVGPPAECQAHLERLRDLARGATLAVARTENWRSCAVVSNHWLSPGVRTELAAFNDRLHRRPEKF
jgi:hypothetical protein